MIEPLPFSLRIPKRDHVTFLGFESVKARVAGLLHFEEDTLIFEWQIREKTERFGFEGIGNEYETFPAEAIEVPAEWIAEIRVRSFFVITFVQFRARRLDAFEGMPTASGGLVTLRIGMKDRRAVAAMVAAIEKARHALPYQAPNATRQLPAADHE